MDLGPVRGLRIACVSRIGTPLGRMGSRLRDANAAKFVRNSSQRMSQGSYSGLVSVTMASKGNDLSV